ncbi:hypothetical protein [Glutamicibacter arilaitensis]|uniref:hypothetical protein n=1 Tax=Glutamicibacter arilaitensis TaxID=256701 RepID=UPI003850F0C5
MANTVNEIVLVSVARGSMPGMFFTKTTQKSTFVSPWNSVLAITLFVAGTGVKVRENGLWILIALLSHNILELAVGCGIGRLLRSRRQTVTRWPWLFKCKNLELAGGLSR